MLGQATGQDSEVIIYPQAIFKDPFCGGNNILVICDAYTPAGEPIPTNKCHRAAEIFTNKKVADEVPWYGIEQEYTLLQQNVKWPLGWPVGGYPGPQALSTCIVVLTTVVLGQTNHLAVTYHMLITKLAYMPELTSVVHQWGGYAWPVGVSSRT